ERDLNKQEHILSQIQADGDMQDMLVFVSLLQRVGIVAIGFARLTTNRENLKVLLNKKNNPNMKKLVVDITSSCDASHIYDTKELLNDSNTIKVFDCRKKGLQDLSDFFHKAQIKELC
ncbi:hypothetical protein BY458DRAFT_434939, partial [Sporodiniella umbellata]